MILTEYNKIWTKTRYSGSTQKREVTWRNGKSDKKPGDFTLCCSYSETLSASFMILLVPNDIKIMLNKNTALNLV